MTVGALFAYGVRMALGRGAWVAPVLALAGVLAWYRGDSAGDWLPLFEVFLPLVSVALVVPALMSEKEGGTWSLLLSYPVDRIWLFLSKTLPALALALLLPLGVWAIMYGLGLPLDRSLLALSFPGLFFLSGLAVTGCLMAPHAASAYLFPVGWWALDFVTRGRITKTFYLFNAAYPQDGVDLYATKFLLLLVGAVLWTVSVAYFRRVRAG